VKKLVACFVGLFLLACEKKSEVTETRVEQIENPSASASSEPSAGSVPRAAIDQITQEDFEEEALIDISADNLEEELDKLEAEIGE
jgi:hypothetical protein